MRPPHRRRLLISNILSIREAPLPVSEKYLYWSQKGTTVAVAGGPKLNLFRNGGDEVVMASPPLPPQTSKDLTGHSISDVQTPITAA